MIPSQNDQWLNREIEFAAQNIVYQLGDFYELPVDLRQKTNDEAIDFVKKIIKAELVKARENNTEPNININHIGYRSNLKGRVFGLNEARNIKGMPPDCIIKISRKMKSYQNRLAQLQSQQPLEKN